MDKIANAFARAKTEKRPALIIYETAGNPDMENSYRIFAAAIEGGADIIEIGIPFSDPIADGTVIQKSSQRALASGADFRGALKLTEKLNRNYPDIPLIIFSYYNVLFQYGVEKLAREAEDFGISGLLIVDLPYEEQAEVSGILKQYRLPLIQLISPATPLERAEKILKTASGFVYCINVCGITGERSKLPASAAKRLDDIRKISPIPVAAGFGISNAETVQMFTSHADGVIVGSAAVKLVEQSATSAAAAQKTRDFVRSLLPK